MHSMPGCKKPCKAKFLECNRVHSTRAFIRNRCQHRCASRPNDQKRHASRRTAFGPTLSSNESIDDLSTGPDESDGTSSSNRYSTREGLDSPTMGPFSDSRRHAILSALGHIAGAHMISRKEAVAFPSPNLETLQESAATSSRCGGDVGISALRNPAIYRWFQFLKKSNWLTQRGFKSGNVYLAGLTSIFGFCLHSVTVQQMTIHAELSPPSMGP